MTTQGGPVEALEGVLRPEAVRLDASALTDLTQSELVGTPDATGSIRAGSWTACPPEIPDVLPGERVFAELVVFLRGTAASPSGCARGWVDPWLKQFGVDCQESASTSRGGSR